MKAKFTNPQYVEDCIKAMQSICTTYCTGVPTTIKEIINIVNTLSPLHITTAKLLLEHNMIHEDGSHIVVRNGKLTKRTVPTYKFRPVLERPHARAFVLEVLQKKYKTSQKNYEKTKSKDLVEEEVDIEELNTSLDELLEESKPETPLKEFIEKEPVSCTFFHTTEPIISLEEAIKVVKSYGGTITF